MPFLLASGWTLTHFGMILLLVVGFGFVIFWHELGHFLAAKYVGIRVEQFAVGFGQALVSWRKGVGFRFGNTQKDYRERIEKHLIEREKQDLPPKEKPQFTEDQVAAAAAELGLGETEYRLNWIPLGGYVKMLGQDDLKPDALADDPNAYNRKSVRARMLVISAGVIMNIILAAIGFMILFLSGFHVPPAYAGIVIPGSPAQKAGLAVGDRLLYLDGKRQDDFTKTTLTTALLQANAPVQMVVERPTTDDPNCKTFQTITMTVTPARANGEKGFLQIGFANPPLLEVPKRESGDSTDDPKLHRLYLPEQFLLHQGDKIVAVNGTPVQPEDYIRFHKLLQESFGSLVHLAVVSADGKPRDELLQPHFQEPFGGSFNLIGLVPRTMIVSLLEDSPLLTKDVQPGDVIESIKDVDSLPNPSREKLVARLKQDGDSGQPITLNLLRGNQPITVSGVKATVRVEEGRKGLGVGLALDEKHAVIADVLAGSPAEQAGFKNGDRITRIVDQDTKSAHDVATWYDLQRTLSGLTLNPKTSLASLTVTCQRQKMDKIESVDLTLKLDKAQLDAIHEVRYYAPYLPLEEFKIVRKAKDPLQAAAWGVTETRDFILQFYLTLRRMVDGSVSPSNMMGPVGIFIAGDRFADRGPDWLLWFLAMISANLAVVNFLPIPVVDGGQFMFLVFEKIKGKPISTRTMVIAQYAGLAFLAAVVLFVTYHDILRQIFKQY